MAKEVTVEEVSIQELLDGKNGDALIAKVGFEQGLKLLEELVARVESGALPLDKAIAAYERGVALVERLKTHLGGAEEKLKILQRPK